MYKATMKPTLREYNNIQLSPEQTQFDARVAVEIMGWKKLDDSNIDAFLRHALPASTYPFFETTSSKGILMYHPTPYHGQMFSPSYSSEDDLATFITLLRKQSESLSTILSTLNFIHIQRGRENAGFQPTDEFYHIARYYQPGDLATVALHILNQEKWRDERNPEKVLNELKIKYPEHMLEEHGVFNMTLDNGRIKIFLLKNQNMSEEFTNHVMWCPIPIDFVISE